MKISVLFALAMVPALSLDTLAAQEGDNGLAVGRRHVSAYVAGSWSDRFGPAYSSIPTQPYGMIVGRAEYVVEATASGALSFYMELMPVIVMDGVPRYHMALLWQPPAGPMVNTKVWDEPAVVYGAGITPAGVQLYGNVTRMVSLFANLSGGVAWFTRDMPVPDARRLNFLVDVGGGLRVARRDGSGNALLMGFKFHHMSNAGRGPQNPGIDGNVIYAGLSKAR
jgi:hypothetical protein